MPEIHHSGASGHQPRVFISHTSREAAEKEWVTRFAGDLRSAGLHVVLDRWDLQFGDDLTRFMVHGIEQADFVLMVCTPAYAEKALATHGGVAFEHMIISGAIHTHTAASNKFIPILRLGEPARSIPAYLRNRYFADFRQEDAYTSALQQLVPALYHLPDVSLPPEAMEATAEPGPAGAEGVPAPTAPSAWMLIAGTGKSQLAPRLAETSTALGALLARNRLGLVTGGWAGVDELAARTFARALEAQGLPLENFLIQVVNNRKFPAFPAGRLVFVEPGESEWTEGIVLADAVILAGGLGGTYTTGATALEWNKPVFPLADTGGDALRLYQELYRSWAERSQVFGRITKEQFMQLGREAPGVVQVLPQLIQQIT